MKDEVFYEDYQKERASILFPHLRKEIAQNIDNLNVSEVDRGRRFFYQSYRTSAERAVLITERTQQIPDPTAYSVADGGCETNRFQRERARAVSAVYSQFEFMEALIMRGIHNSARYHSSRKCRP